MNLPNVGRTKLTKGVSLLAIFALTGIGYSSFSSEVKPEEMLAKTDFELEGLADPLFEELFQDKYHRALEVYNESKGLFSCDEICGGNMRRLNLIGRELSAVQDQRAAARKAVLIRGREQRLMDTQARQEANLERRQFSHISSDERISVRRLVRKAEKDAERAMAITAYRASLGIGDPLTLAEKQARSAAAKAARIAARVSRKTPAEAAADADARQDARWFDYLDEVAQAHGFYNWANVEQFMDHTPEERQAIREGNQNDGLLESRANVRAAARHATLRTPAPTPSPTPAPTTPAPTPTPCDAQGCVDRCVGRYGGPWNSGTSYYCAKGCASVSSFEMVNLNVYCDINRSVRYQVCLANTDHGVSSNQSNVLAAKWGCEYWN